MKTVLDHFPHVSLSFGIGWLWDGLLMLRVVGNNEGMYGMTDIRGLDSGLSSGGIMGMMTSSWSHTWKAFGCEWLRAVGMCSGLTPSISPSFFRSSSTGPSKQSVEGQKKWNGRTLEECLLQQVGWTIIPKINYPERFICNFKVTQKYLM